MEQRILDQVIYPTLRGLRNDGIRYTGFLYAGLMITPVGIPKVIEFNCRMGDPETQPIMARLRSDLVTICLATLDGRLAEHQADWDPRASLGVVMAAGGYPGEYRKGDPISGLAAADSADCKVFHAGTEVNNGQVRTNGGRVLCVVGLGESVAEAQRSAYSSVAAIQWDDAYFRKDIGHRAVRRSSG
jgi:phosphoribosylamine--glycine ligase